MPSGNTRTQLELTSVANRHRLCGMGYIPIGIADVIEASAEARGISLLQLSKKSGLSYSGVLRKVRYRSRRINVDDLCAFADALEVQPSELVKQAESRAEAEAQKPNGYAIQDKPSAVVILQASRGSIYDEDVPA
nr:MAG TPA: structural protein [Caudoviricetes sp.]